MSTGGSTATDRDDTVGTAPTGHGPRHRPRRRGARVVVVAGVVVVLLAGGAVAVDRAGLWPEPAASRPTAGHVPTSTATVARRYLSARTTVSGTLGYSGDFTVIGQSHGTVTWLPAVGSVVRQGRVLYEVDGHPVVLLYGRTPVYRDLAGGANASDVTGSDVRQLNAALVALGYADRADLDPDSDEFGWATRAGVMRLQEHLGVERTGRLEMGQVVFLPTAARITKVTGSLGGSATGPLLSASSTHRRVTVDLDAAQQSQVKVGDRVGITLPDGDTTPGRVSSVAKVATSSGGAAAEPKVRVVVTPLSPAVTGSMDKAPVQVAITTDSVRDALVVPVTALLALAGGGYAVEVVGDGGRHRLLPVTLGLFDDTQGLVQVHGKGLAVGQRVVVPAS